YQTPLRSVSSGSIAERSTPSGGGGGSGSGWPVHPLRSRPMATAAVRARTRIRRLLTGVGDASGLGTLARERVGAEAHVVGDARGAHDEAGLLVELRSEERRVGKEWRARWAPDHGKEEWRR